MLDVNLKAMLTIKEKLGVSIGYSDHTIGTNIPVYSTFYGATCIEKHFTLDKNMSGPDHKASSTPEEFAQLVQAIRTAEISLGSCVKNFEKGTDLRKVISPQSHLKTTNFYHLRPNANRGKGRCFLKSCLRA